MSTSTYVRTDRQQVILRGLFYSSFRVSKRHPETKTDTPQNELANTNTDKENATDTTYTGTQTNQKFILLWCVSLAETLPSQTTKKKTSRGKEFSMIHIP